MSIIEARIATLERRSHYASKPILLSLYVDSLNPFGEVYELTDTTGNSWTRQPDESEEQFMDRACANVQRNASGVAHLTGFCECGEAKTRSQQSGVLCL
jgi:hypothetical protein